MKQPVVEMLPFQEQHGAMYVEQFSAEGQWNFNVYTTTTEYAFPGYFDHESRYEVASGILYLQAICNGSDVVWALALDQASQGYAQTINDLMSVIISTSSKIKFCIQQEEFLFCTDTWYPVKSISDKGAYYALFGFGLDGFIKVPKENTTVEDTSLKDSATLLRSKDAIKSMTQKGKISSSETPTTKAAPVQVGPEKTELFGNTVPNTSESRNQTGVQFMSSEYCVSSELKDQKYLTTIVARQQSPIKVSGIANRVEILNAGVWVHITDGMNQRVYLATPTPSESFQKNWNDLMSRRFKDYLRFFITKHYIHVSIPSLGVILECLPETLSFDEDGTLCIFPESAKSLVQGWPEIPVRLKGIISKGLRFQITDSATRIMDLKYTLLAFGDPEHNSIEKYI